jgi:acyl-CoA thioesterase I
MQAFFQQRRDGGTALPYGPGGHLFKRKTVRTPEQGTTMALIRRKTLAVIILAIVLLWPGMGPSQAQNAAPSGRGLKILTLGDSLSAGYGLPREASFTSQLERALQQKGYRAAVPQTGVSGETTAGGLARLEWMLADRPDLAIVALGANDSLRGIDPTITRSNLDRILARLKERGVKVVLAGMLAPRNLGPDYGRAFDAIYPDLAAKHGVALYPFFLEGVAMRPALNLDDGMHPTADGVAIMVKGILPLIERTLGPPQG